MLKLNSIPRSTLSQVNDVDVCFDLSSEEDINYNLFFEDLERTFLNIIALMSKMHYKPSY